MSIMEPVAPWQDVRQIGNCTLYLGDCLDVLPMLKDSIDCIVTSPPYDNLREYDGFEGVDCLGVISLCARALKDGGVMVWNVADATVNGSETGTSFKQALHAQAVGLRLHDTMIYQRSGVTSPQPSRYHQAFEYMFVLSRGAPAVFNGIKDRKNLVPGRQRTGGMRKADGTVKGARTFVTQENGLRYNYWPAVIGGDDRGGHPAPMPPALADGHIRTWTNPGALICDPFMGSGTTGVEAVKCGRRFVGIEISRKYFDIACKRIEDAVAQPSMFAAR